MKSYSGTSAQIKPVVESFGQSNLASGSYNLHADSSESLVASYQELLDQQITSISDSSVKYETEIIKSNTNNSFRHTNTGSSSMLFSMLFKINPEVALINLKRLVLSNFLDKEDAISWLFPVLVNSRDEVSNLTYEAIVSFESARHTLDIAIKYFRGGWGDKYLQFAVSILDELGEKSFDVIFKFFEKQLEETEYFIDTFISSSAFSDDQKLEALAPLAHSSHANVRFTLLDSLRNQCHELTFDFAKSLSNDNDDEIRNLAKEVLSERRKK